MWKSKPVVDLEGGSTPLHPIKLEVPAHGWAFIRKLYTIVTLQLLLTIAVAYAVVRVDIISSFFVTHYRTGFAIYMSIIVFYIIASVLVYLYYERHPLNLIILALFTFSLALLVGVSCAFTRGEVILEAAILTAAVVITLTLYTFWAARRGHDFFLGSFLWGALSMIILSSLLQIFYPLGPISTMLYGGLASIIFCGYIIFDTVNLIEHYSEHDKYISAALALYLDIMKLFLQWLKIFGSSKK